MIIIMSTFRDCKGSELH